MISNPKILVVDDRPENLFAVRAVLENLPVEILEASSGDAALRLLLEHEFAVILLDVEMPGTDGFATAEIIRARQKTRLTPIIFLTAVDRGEPAIQRGYELGAVDFIIKPFRPDVLRWKVSVFAALHAKNAQTEELLKEQAARREWETAAKRLELLANVTSLLSSSMNYSETLERLPRLVVPEFADWAFVLNREEHPDAFAKIVRGSAPTLNARLEPSFFETLGTEDKGPGSALVVPLSGNRVTHFALIMFKADPGRYTLTDRLLAEDLAERAALAISNAQLFEDAQAANRAKDQFLAVVSHELRTPLNAIVGWTHLLRTRNLDPAATDKAFRTIERNARLQDELISDILDISRVVAGQLSVTFSDVDLESVLRKTLDAVKPSADAKHIQIVANPAPNLPRVAGDEKRLQQVLWNLLANAIKFTPKNGRIDASLSATDSAVSIQVKDSGAGIRPEVLARIFDPFIQGDSTLKRSHGGLGLGLAIARHLVELHGGRVTAESGGEGQGSTFTVTLPIRQAERRAC